MALIDTAIPDGVWTAICEVLAVPESTSDLRECIGAAFGRYKANLVHGGDVKPADVRKALLNCADDAEVFLKSFGPLVTDFDDGALSTAGMRLATSLKRDFNELIEIMASIVEIRDRCRQLAPDFAVGGGPAPQDSRNIFILRVSEALKDHEISSTNRAISEAMSILMKTAGASSPPSTESLETTIRKIRSEHRKRIKRI